jgi:tubulin---tyrosine ligase
VQVFGLDFMIDDDFKVFLIEVNTNPCLELCSPLLARLIPNMLENAFRIVTDPLFPPPDGFSQKK